MRAGAGGLPTALRRHGRWLEVIEVLDGWRTDDRWWTEHSVSRAYHELLLEDGRVVTVFWDETGARWWEQRYG